MRSTTEVQAEIVATKAALMVAKEKKKGAEKERDAVRQERNNLIDHNPIAAERRRIENLKEQLHSWGMGLIILPIVADVALFVLLLLLEGILERMIGGDPLQLQLTILAIPLALIIPGIILLVVSAVQNGKIDKLTAQLREFDIEKQPLEDKISMLTKQITECDEFIAKQNNCLARCETEIKFAAYAKNHIMLFVAEEGASSDQYRSIKNSIIIDGVEYGAASMPFKTIELTPGLHTIRVNVAVYFSERYHIYSSDFIQVRAESDSVFLKCVFKGPSRPFSFEKFTDINAFFEAINYEP